MTDRISGSVFKQMVLFGAACITLERETINDLNVFPVPDGDTGTNMSLTIQTAAAELKKNQPATVSDAASITASALLRGARGNSGVILSLLFRGISKHLKGMDEADGVLLAAAMKEGVATAYSAVMKPAEGTVLTVSRLAADRAVQAAEECNSVEYVLQEAIHKGLETLEETIEMNPVLKKAGVVDAGGKGYLVILDGMLRALRGEAIPEVTEEKAESKADFSSMSQEEITFTFDTVFIVRKWENTSIEPLRAYLSSIGDCLVIGEDDEAFKVHVHTDIPGCALTEAQKYGTLELAKIENMRTQYEAVAAGKKAQSADDLDAVEEELERMESEPAVAPAEKRYGFLAVCAGEGLATAFRDLGVDRIVSGGQTMNPSTDDILKVINKTPASTVFVFPNNKNIIMAAEQCVPLSEKKVIVMPTKTVPQGISALLNFNPDEEEAALVEVMQEAAGSVHTAMVTYAARDSDFDGHAIKAGEHLALLDGALLGSYPDVNALMGDMVEAFADLEPEFITVYYGADVDENDAAQAAEVITARFPDADISVVNGGQPVYYYMISVE